MLQAGFLGTAFFILCRRHPAHHAQLLMKKCADVSSHAFNAVVLRKPVPRWVLALSVVSLWALVLFLGTPLRMMHLACLTAVDLAGPLLVPKDQLHPFYG